MTIYCPSKHLNLQHPFVCRLIFTFIIFLFDLIMVGTVQCDCGYWRTHSHILREAPQENSQHTDIWPETTGLAAIFMIVLNVTFFLKKFFCYWRLRGGGKLFLGMTFEGWDISFFILSVCFVYSTVNIFFIISV